MNRNKLKAYAPQARRDFIKAVTDRAAYYGLTNDKMEPITEQGDVAIIAGKPFPRAVAEKRKRLEERIRQQGFEQVMEAMAYTWFNRFVAIRFMEIHGYLDHGYRVLSTTNYTNYTNGKNGETGPSVVPDILKYAEHVDLPGVDQDEIIQLKLAGNEDEELYRMLLIAQCNALHKAMPFLFEWVDDETELLLPENLLHCDSVIRKLVNEIPEEQWQEVEIIGWMYQFYISEKKDQVIGKVVKSEDIPAATQLFTPNWIVKYMIQNTLGRQWMATYPHSSLKEKMEFYIEPAEQTPEVQEQLKAITPDSLNHEELTLLDPACGSGHILVEAYDLLKTIYQERGYRSKDIPRLILEKNLYGLEIDDRAAQLAAFALMMKARADDRRIFSNGARPHVLAIQESKGLKAKEITEALNAPILKAKLPPREFLFEEMDEKRAPLFSRNNLSIKGDIDQADVAQLIELFEQGKTFGTLICVPDKLAEKLPAIAERVKDVLTDGEMFGQAAARASQPIVEQTRILAGRYNAVVTNPPYMSSKFFVPALKSYLKQHFAGYEKDIYSSFIARCKSFCNRTGSVGFMSPFTWMFISIHRQLRNTLITDATITSLIQLEYSGFAEATVPICTFTLTNCHINKFSASFIKLSDFRGADNQAPKTIEAIQNPNCGWFYTSTPDDFTVIPGSPIAYWLSRDLLATFTNSHPLAEIASPQVGITSSDNDRFLRRWYEVRHEDIGFGYGSSERAKAAAVKWFPYNKGGQFRKWYGNNEFVIHWKDDGTKIKHAIENNPRDPKTTHWSRRIFNTESFFKECITWSLVSSSYFGVRHSDQGFLFDVGGSSAFPPPDKKPFVLGLLCSNLAFVYLRAINPTLNFQPGNIGAIPVVHGTYEKIRTAVERIVERAVSISRIDWDSRETSWDFQRFPFFEESNASPTVKESFLKWAAKCGHRKQSLRELETENNRLFISAYGLEHELSPDVHDEHITLFSAELEEDIKRLMSYAIGCMMGRYSLDKPGLIYAHSGNERFWEIYLEKHDKAVENQNENNSCHSCNSWSSFPPDQDGIIPITDTASFEDDATVRVVEFIGVAWPKEHLEENLKFVAKSLGPKREESPRDTIRRYLVARFYKQHLSMYKKRPIYWLFSSGKLRAFQCLVYLHRYNEGTLSRMRTEYVIPLQGKIGARIDHLGADSKAATSTSHRKKLEREQDKLVKQQAELQSFDEKLRHYADKRISLDLDDGVKVNYGKFGDLLAEVKAIIGKKGK